MAWIVTILNWGMGNGRCMFFLQDYIPLDCTITLKWNESGFRPSLCTYKLNWARRTSWGWWDEWDDTVLQTRDSKFEPWRSEAEHATSRSRRLPTILTFTRGWGRNIFCFFQTAETGSRTPNSGVKGSGANHYPIMAPALYNNISWQLSRHRSMCYSNDGPRLRRWSGIGPTHCAC